MQSPAAGSFRFMVNRVAPKRVVSDFNLSSAGAVALGGRKGKEGLECMVVLVAMRAMHAMRMRAIHGIDAMHRCHR